MQQVNVASGVGRYSVIGDDVDDATVVRRSPVLEDEQDERTSIFSRDDEASPLPLVLRAAVTDESAPGVTMETAREFDHVDIASLIPPPRTSRPSLLTPPRASGFCVEPGSLPPVVIDDAPRTSVLVPYVNGAVSERIPEPRKSVVVGRQERARTLFMGFAAVFAAATIGLIAGHAAGRRTASAAAAETASTPTVGVTLEQADTAPAPAAPAPAASANGVDPASLPDAKVAPRTDGAALPPGYRPLPFDGR